MNSKHYGKAANITIKVWLASHSQCAFNTCAYYLIYDRVLKTYDLMKATLQMHVSKTITDNLSKHFNYYLFHWGHKYILHYVPHMYQCFIRSIYWTKCVVYWANLYKYIYSVISNSYDFPSIFLIYISNTRYTYCAKTPHTHTYIFYSPCI